MSRGVGFVTISVSQQRLCCISNVFFLMIFCGFFTGCSSTRLEGEVIPYLIPEETEQMLYDSIQKYEGKQLNFLLQNVVDRNYILKCVVFEDLEQLKGSPVYNEMAQLTQRKLFVNDRFYPLVLHSDYLFFPEFNEADTIKKQSYKAELTKLPIAFSWLLDSKGQFLELAKE